MTTPFFVITPTPVTDATLISSTEAEDDYAEYSSLTTYASATRVILGSGYHKIYESLQGGNMGHFPPDNPTFWLEVGPTNRWAAFDESGGTFTTATSPYTFVVSGNSITSMGFIDLTASTVRIQASAPPVGTYYDQTYSIGDSAIVLDWYNYFYTEIIQKPDLIVTDIPARSNSQYTITITHTDDVVFGTFVMGIATTLGLTRYAPRIGIVDYSRKEVDEFGRATLVRRTFSKRMDVDFYISSGSVDSIVKFLSGLRATNVLWVGVNELYNSLTIFGFYRDFSVEITYPTFSICSLQVEGLSQ